jgi:hypothetical protein
MRPGLLTATQVEGTFCSKGAVRRRVRTLEISVNLKDITQKLSFRI